MQGCSTRVTDERQRSENGHDTGPLKEVGAGVSPQSRQAFINVTMTCVLPKYNQNLLSLPIHRVIFCGQKTRVNLYQAH